MGMIDSERIFLASSRRILRKLLSFNFIYSSNEGKYSAFLVFELSMLTRIILIPLDHLQNSGYLPVLTVLVATTET